MKKLYIVSLLIFFHFAVSASGHDSIFNLRIAGKVVPFVVSCDTAVMWFNKSFGTDLATGTLVETYFTAIYDKSTIGEYHPGDSAFQIDPVTLEEVLVVFERDVLVNRCELHLQNLKRKKVKTEPGKTKEMDYDLGVVSKDSLIEGLQKGLFLEDDHEPMNVKSLGLFYKTGKQIGYFEMECPSPGNKNLDIIRAMKPSDFIVIVWFVPHGENTYDQKCYPEILIRVK